MLQRDANVRIVDVPTELGFVFEVVSGDAYGTCNSWKLAALVVDVVSGSVIVVFVVRLDWSVPAPFVDR